MTRKWTWYHVVLTAVEQEVGKPQNICMFVVFVSWNSNRKAVLHFWALLKLLITQPLWRIPANVTSVGVTVVLGHNGTTEIGQIPITNNLGDRIFQKIIIASFSTVVYTASFLLQSEKERVYRFEASVEGTMQRTWELICRGAKKLCESFLPFMLRFKDLSSEPSSRR